MPVQHLQIGLIFHLQVEGSVLMKVRKTANREAETGKGYHCLPDSLHEFMLHSGIGAETEETDVRQRMIIPVLTDAVEEHSLKLLYLSPYFIRRIDLQFINFVHVLQC